MNDTSNVGKTSTMHTEQLTFTRFMAALTIVILHFGDTVFPFNNKYIVVLVHQASLSVNYFFFLSGFVMILAYRKKDKEISFKTFVVNRAARILPVYYVGFLLMLLYFSVKATFFTIPGTYRINIIDCVLNAFLIQSWVPDRVQTINAAAWSLSAEAFFYVVFPIVFNKLYLTKKNRSILWYVIIFFIASQVIFHVLSFLYPAQGIFFLTFPLFRINEFFAGNILGIIFIYQKRFKQRNMLIPILFFFSVTIAAAYFPVKNINYIVGLFVIYFAPLLFCMALDNGPIAQLFKKRFMVYLGEISYSLYILQFPVYFFFTAALTVFHFKINQPLFYLYLGILIFSAGLSFRFIERPLRDYIKKLAS